MPLLIKCSDGGVSIMYLAPGADAAEAVAKYDALHKHVVSYEEIAQSIVPADRTFRNAWKHDLSVDMPAARAIHRARLRALRGAKFAQWDAEWMKATAAGDAAGAAAAEAKRVQLRAAPQSPLIDAANTPEDLKAAIPPILSE